MVGLGWLCRAGRHSLCPWQGEGAVWGLSGAAQWWHCLIVHWCYPRLAAHGSAGIVTVLSPMASLSADMFALWCIFRRVSGPCGFQPGHPAGWSLEGEQSPCSPAGARGMAAHARQAEPAYGLGWARPGLARLCRQQQGTWRQQCSYRLRGWKHSWVLPGGDVSVCVPGWLPAPTACARGCRAVACKPSQRSCSILCGSNQQPPPYSTVILYMGNPPGSDARAETRRVGGRCACGARFTRETAVCSAVPGQPFALRCLGLRKEQGCGKGRGRESESWRGHGARLREGHGMWLATGCTHSSAGAGRQAFFTTPGDCPLWLGDAVTLVQALAVAGIAVPAPVQGWFRRSGTATHPPGSSPGAGACGAQLGVRDGDRVPTLGWHPGWVFLSPCVWQGWSRARGLPLPPTLQCFTTRAPDPLAEPGAAPAPQVEGGTGKSPAVPVMGYSSPWHARGLSPLSRKVLS